MLCAATGGLRELLLARGEDPPRQGLRAMVPVNIRREGDHGELGNKVSSLFVDLPVAEADPLRRYELVRAAVEKRKAGGQALAASAVTGLTELAPPVLHASLARSLFAKRLFNVTITNVPGSPRRVYAFGAALVDVVPIVPLAAEHARRDRRRLLRRRDDVRAVRRPRHRARPRCTEGRHRRLPARVDGSGASAGGCGLARRLRGVASAESSGAQRRQLIDLGRPECAAKPEPATREFLDHRCQRDRREF